MPGKTSLDMTMTPSNFHEVIKPVIRRVEWYFPTLQGGDAEDVVYQFLCEQLDKKGLRSMDAQSVRALLNWQLIYYRALNRKNQKKRFSTLDGEDGAEIAVTTKPRSDFDLEDLVQGILRWSEKGLRLSERDEVIRAVMRFEGDFDSLSDELKMELAQLLAKIEEHRPVIDKLSLRRGLRKMRELYTLFARRK